MDRALADVEAYVEAYVPGIRTVPYRAIPNLGRSRTAIFASGKQRPVAIALPLTQGLMA